MDCVYADSEDNLLPIIEVLSKCPSLRALHLKCYEVESLFMEKIDQFNQLCNKVEHLSLFDDTRGCYVYKDGLSLIKNCTQLRHLQIRFPAEGTLDFLLESAIIKKALLLHLSTLEIICTNLPLNNDHCSLLANSGNLDQLLLTGTSSTIEGLTMICTSPVQRLQVLNIVIDWNLQLNLITDYLIHLRVFHCTIASSEVNNIGSIGKLGQLRSLFLSVWPCIQLDDDIIQIMSGCNLLQNLSINGEAGDTSLMHIGTLCPLIEKLEIALNNSTSSSVSNLTVQGLTTLKHLRYLSLQQSTVTDDAVEVLLLSCPHIQQLQLTRADKLTFGVFEILHRAAEKKCEKQSDARGNRIALKVQLPAQLIKSFGQRSSCIQPSPSLQVTFA